MSGAGQNRPGNTLLSLMVGKYGRPDIGLQSVRLHLGHLFGLGFLGTQVCSQCLHLCIRRFILLPSHHFALGPPSRTLESSCETQLLC